MGLLTNDKDVFGLLFNATDVVRAVMGREGMVDVHVLATVKVVLFAHPAGEGAGALFVAVFARTLNTLCPRIGRIFQGVRTRHICCTLGGRCRQKNDTASRRC